MKPKKSEVRRIVELVADAMQYPLRHLAKRIAALEKRAGLEPPPYEGPPTAKAAGQRAVARSAPRHSVGEEFVMGGVRWKCVAPNRYRNIEHYGEVS